MTEEELTEDQIAQRATGNEGQSQTLGEQDTTEDAEREERDYGVEPSSEGSAGWPEP
jgi:hypothetical protein